MDEDHVTYTYDDPDDFLTQPKTTRAQLQQGQEVALVMVSQQRSEHLFYLE